MSSSSSNTKRRRHHSSAPLVDPFEKLPEKIALRILECFAAHELCAVAQVSKRWNLLSSNNDLWRHIYVSSFNISDSSASSRQVNWKHIYIKQRRLATRFAICQREKSKIDGEKQVDDDVEYLEIATALGFEDVIMHVMFKLAKKSGKGESGFSSVEVKRHMGTVAVAASAKNNDSIIKQLLKLNQNCASFTDSGGNTPLHTATTKEMAYLLLKAKAPIAAANKDGACPIHTASAGGYLEVVRSLLDPGNIALKTKSGDTAIHLAALNGHLAVVRLLVAYGSDPKALNNAGQNALHMASIGNSIEIVMYLIDKGCNLNLVDYAGNSPIDLCAAYGHLNLVVSLLEKSGKIIPPPTIESLASKHIGSGAFGDVYLACLKGKNVAVKKVRYDKLLAAGKEPKWIHEKFVLEVALMNKLSNNSNFVSMIGACISPPNLCLVLEYMSGGSLYDVIHGAKRGSQQLPHVNVIARCLAEGMAFLHSQTPQILHRDLTSANILLDNHNMPKIADFGISRFKLEIGDQTMTYIGNPRWRAPEITRGERYSSQVDVYAFGLILWELVSGKIPFFEMDGTPASIHAADGKRPEMPPDCPGLWAELIQRCWQDNPAKRPTFAQVLDILPTLPPIPVKIGRSESMDEPGYTT